MAGHDEALISAFAAIGVAVGSIIFSIYQQTKIQKFQKELEKEKDKRAFEQNYDVSLRADRVKAFKELWELLHFFKDIQHENRPIEKKDFEKFLSDLRVWYHVKGGGMWLSRASLDKGYWILKHMVQDLKNKGKSYDKPEVQLDKLYRQLSAFRTVLTFDLGSRRVLEIVNYDKEKKIVCSICEKEGIKDPYYYPWQLQLHINSQDDEEHKKLYEEITYEKESE